MKSIGPLLDDIGSDPKELSFEADRDVLHAVAERLKCPAVHSLSGSISIHAGGEDLFVSGQVSALLERECVVSLDRLEEPVQDDISLRLSPHLTEDDETSSEDVDVLGPPFVENGRLNIAEIFAQQVALAMDPFPRSPNSENESTDDKVKTIDVGDETEGAEVETHRPFETLSALLDKKDGKGSLR